MVKKKLLSLEQLTYFFMILKIAFIILNKLSRKEKSALSFPSRSTILRNYFQYKK